MIKFIGQEAKTRRAVLNVKNLNYGCTFTGEINGAYGVYLVGYKILVDLSDPSRVWIEPNQVIVDDYHPVDLEVRYVNDERTD